MTTPTKAKDNALAFVGQIMTAYKAVMKAEGQALKYAIECGEASGCERSAGAKHRAQDQMSASLVPEAATTQSHDLRIT